MVWTGFEPGTPGRKANTITNELKRILLSSVVMVLAFRPGVSGSNPVRILYFCHAFIHLFLCCGLCLYDGGSSSIGQKPLIPFNVKKWTFCLIGFPSAIYDDFKKGCVTGDHSFNRGCFPI